MNTKSNIVLIITKWSVPGVVRKFEEEPPEAFYEERRFTKFTGKHLCQSLFFNKVAGLRPEICKISKSTFFTEHLWTTASKHS